MSQQREHTQQKDETLTTTRTKLTMQHVQREHNKETTTKRTQQSLSIREIALRHIDLPLLPFDMFSLPGLPTTYYVLSITYERYYRLCGLLPTHSTYLA